MVALRLVAARLCIGSTKLVHVCLLLAVSLTGLELLGLQCHPSGGAATDSSHPFPLATGDDIGRGSSGPLEKSPPLASTKTSKGKCVHWSHEGHTHGKVVLGSKHFRMLGRVCGLALS